MALRDCRMYEARYPEVDDVVMVQVRPRLLRRQLLPSVLRRPLPSRRCRSPTQQLPPSRRAASCYSGAYARWGVQVKSIAEMGAYVSLLEYNNIEGMILLSELSRRRIRSVTKLIKARRAASAGPAGQARPEQPARPAAQVGRVEPVMVLRVDKEKGYIDLSKR